MTLRVAAYHSLVVPAARMTGAVWRRTTGTSSAGRVVGRVTERVIMQAAEQCTVKAMVEPLAVAVGSKG